MKHNKQKIDWEKEFNYNFPDGIIPTDIDNIKKFISQLLLTQRQQLISEIEGIVKENRKGTFTDEGGNDCWYIDDLVKELKILEKK